MLKIEPSLNPKEVTGKRFTTPLQYLSVMLILVLCTWILWTVVGFVIRVFPTSIWWILLILFSDGGIAAVIYILLQQPRSTVVLGEREMYFFGGKAVPHGGYPEECRMTSGTLLYSDIREIGYVKGRYVQTGYMRIGISARGEKYVPPKLTLTVDGYEITVFADRSVYRRIQKIRSEQGYI